MEHSPDSLNKVIKFVRATGDLQTLSDVDLKLIALTYTVESQIHGTNHLRDAPLPVHVVNVKRLPERDLPDGALMFLIWKSGKHWNVNLKMDPILTRKSFP